MRNPALLAARADGKVRPLAWLVARFTGPCSPFGESVKLYVIDNVQGLSMPHIHLIWSGFE